jgi:hypothetical protein
MNVSNTNTLALKKERSKKLKKEILTLNNF